MERWRKVWRDGVSPGLSEAHLQALASALRNNESTLLQGVTTTPPPLFSVQNRPVEAACALSYCGWKGDEILTVGEVDAFFARKCIESDSRTGPGEIRWFLNWFDEVPRDVMRRLLLSEVERSLSLLPSCRPAKLA